MEKNSKLLNFLMVKKRSKGAGISGVVYKVIVVDYDKEVYLG